MPDKECQGLVAAARARRGEWEGAARPLRRLRAAGRRAPEAHLAPLRRLQRSKKLPKVFVGLLPKDPMEWYYHGVKELRSSKKKKNFRNLLYVKNATLRC
mmetsp:Transcript_41292/g.71107  ORF Transcript_41292/g.71107 Transcript_41292/m.71107 type:complete len:100 (-) Transcript_41292:233-532(-)